MNAPPDQCLRAMTDDGGFRVITVCTTHTVRGVLDAQRVVGDVARWLGELVTGTVLLRETMAPGYRVQGILHGARRAGALVADSHPDGGSRGLVQRKDDVDPTITDGAVLEMMRTMPHGGLHRGMVAVPAEVGISPALMAYLQESEQVVSMIDVAVSMDGDRVRAAGGYLVQLLPELSQGMLAIMTERLSDFAPVETMLRAEGTTPESIMEEVLYGMPHTRLADSALDFRCRCDAVRLMTTLATLPREQVMEMVRDGKPLEIVCDYCRKEYVLDPEKLKGLLAQS